MDIGEKEMTEPNQSELKRYTPVVRSMDLGHVSMATYSNGAWVTFEDHKRIEDQLRQEIEELKGRWNSESDRPTAFPMTWDQLVSENGRLRQQIERLQVTISSMNRGDAMLLELLGNPAHECIADGITALQEDNERLRGELDKADRLAASKIEWLQKELSSSTFNHQVAVKTTFENWEGWKEEKAKVKLLLEALEKIAGRKPIPGVVRLFEGAMERIAEEAIAATEPRKDSLTGEKGKSDS